MPSSAARVVRREFQIDHVVALSDAWQTGAQQLDDFTRQNFANDPRNLQATVGWVNRESTTTSSACSCL